MDKFKPGGRVIGVDNWDGGGVGTVVCKVSSYEGQEMYDVLFDGENSPHRPYAMYLRKLTKLELALQ